MQAVWVMPVPLACCALSRSSPGISTVILRSLPMVQLVPIFNASISIVREGA